VSGTNVKLCTVLILAMNDVMYMFQLLHFPVFIRWKTNIWVWSIGKAEKQYYSEKTLSQQHSVRHITHMDCSGSEPSTGGCDHDSKSDSSSTLEAWQTTLCNFGAGNLYNRRLELSLFLVSWGGVRPSPLGTSVTNWPSVPAPDDRRWWMWSSRWNENWQGKRKYSEKTCPSATLSTTNLT
jgi:hypothetical protein